MFKLTLQKQQQPQQQQQSNLCFYLTKCIEGPMYFTITCHEHSCVIEYVSKCIKNLKITPFTILLLLYTIFRIIDCCTIIVDRIIHYGSTILYN